MQDYCRLCRTASPEAFRQKVLRKYDVRYVRCPNCDLIQTETPRWLDEAYSEALSVLDVGAIQRNRVCAQVTLSLARLLRINSTTACLDYAAGHGVFVRMMRDAGLDFLWWDRFAKNLYARGFEGDIEKSYRLVTAFEVFEHFADVGNELDRVFRPHHEYLLASTLLHEGNGPDWHYYAPEMGQHIAFYSDRTMRFIAQRFGYDVLIGPSFTLFSRSRLGPLRPLLSILVRHPSVAWSLDAVVPTLVLQKLGIMKSLTDADLDRMRNATLEDESGRPRQ